MYQANAAVWNRIAETQTLETSWAMQMFPLPAEHLDKALALEEARLTALTGSEMVAALVLKIGPLLWESRAVARAGLQHLPALEDVEEAVLMAEREAPMNEAEKASFRKAMIETPMT